MNALQHSLNIGTLATWLSVAGFGAAAMILHDPQPAAPAPKEPAETRWDPQDFTLSGDARPASEESTPKEMEDIAVEETAPSPPELSPLAEFEPLPEVPDPTPAATSKSQTPAPEPQQTARASGGARTTAPSSHSPAQHASGANKSSGNSGLSDSDRISRGHMPSPNYPPGARSMGQTGTVLVEFTVDSAGQVISANALSQSPWPMLNNEAVRTVRHWSFPPGGGVMKLQRPIIFQLR